MMKTQYRLGAAVTGALFIVCSGQIAEVTAQGSQRSIVPSRALTAAASGEGSTVTAVNNWTVGLASGLPEGTFLRFGAEIAQNLNEGGDLRVLPFVTNGATDNVKDLLYLKGIDIGLTNADVLEHFRNVEAIPNIEKRIHMISSMYIGHIHLLVRPEITSLADLEGKKISFHTPGAGASISGPILFQRLGIKVVPVPVNNAIALEQMKSGHLAGLVNTGGKPQDLFNRFKNEQGFKFLSVPFDKFEDLYVPSEFSSADYPGYIKPGEKVQALGVPVVLAVYNWPKESDRYRRVRRFIDFFFDRFDNFKKPPYHPDWKTVNLAAKVPGWTRYWAAEEKLLQMIAAATASPQSQQATIDVRLAREQVARIMPNDPAEQERLFQRFMEWSKTQRRN